MSIDLGPGMSGVPRAWGRVSTEAISIYKPASTGLDFVLQYAQQIVLIVIPCYCENKRACLQKHFLLPNCLRCRKMPFYKIGEMEIGMI